jgi:hypothetical protein
VAQRIAESEEALRSALRSQSAPPPAATTASATLRPATLQWAGIGLFAGGVALALGGGLGFRAAAQQRAHSIEEEAASGAPFDPALDRTRKSFNALSIVFYLIGGVTAVSGGALLGLCLVRRGTRSRGLRLAPPDMPAAVALSVEGQL